MTTCLFLTVLALGSDPDVMNAIQAFQEYCAPSLRLENTYIEDQSTLPPARLMQMGPNALPEVVEACEQNKDVRMYRCYYIVLARITGAEVYVYGDAKRQWHWQDTSENAMPWFSLPTGNGGLDHHQEMQMRCQLYGRWWRERGSFPAPEEQKKTYRAITGTTEAQYAKYDLSGEREVAKRSRIYGIYALPCLMDLITEDNNPIAFFELAKIAQDRVRMLKWKTKPDAAAVREIFPTRESMMEAICGWWDERGSTFTRLEDIHKAIDSRVQKMKEELKRLQAAPAPQEK